MPRPSGHRLPQCSLVVNGRRCMRAGTGTPPLCRSCRAAVLNAARVKKATAVQQAPQGSALGDLIGDFFAGQPFDPSKVGQVLTDMAFNLGGIFGGGYSPPIQDIPQGYTPPVTDDDWQARQREQQRQHQAHYERQQREAARPQVDPALAEARRELGFGPSDRLTDEIIKDRRRVLSRKHHPDLAGTDEKKRKANTARMMRINNAADVLMASLRPEVDAP